jgi:hypothetical protein
VTLSPAGEALVIIPLGPGEFLALTPAELAQARDRARAVLGAGWAGSNVAAVTTQSPEKLCTAKEMEGLTGVPGTWFLETARGGAVPHHKLGKYVRFQIAEVLACSRYRSREAQGAGGKAS